MKTFALITLWLTGGALMMIPLAYVAGCMAASILSH